jgi:hypothetical protein
VPARGFRFHRDALGHVTDLEDYGDLAVFVHLDAYFVLNEFLEPLHFGGQRINADGELGSDVIAALIGRGGADLSGSGVGDGHGSPDNHRSGGVLDGAEDGHRALGEDGRRKKTN